MSGEKGPVIRIFPDIQSLSHGAAEVFRTLARDAVLDHGRFSVALSGGSTPRELYALLAKEPYCDHIDWQHVHLFWADERCVPPAHDDSNYGMAQELLLSRVAIPSVNIHRIRGERGAVQAAADYEEELKAYFGEHGYPLLDLVILGVGADGHTASLFPGSLQISDHDRRAMPVFSGDQGPDRVTLSLPVLNHAKQALMIASGSAKQTVIKHILAEGNPGGVPAGLVRPVTGTVTWFIDREAAAQLSTR